MGYLISVDRLKNRLHNHLNNTVIIDVRFQLKNPDAGRKAYLQDHIPGSLFMDVEKDLSGKKRKHGGNHPLPDLTMLAGKVGKLGIDHDTTVVIYDADNDMFAARAWWLFHYMGHDKVYVLDDGYNGWKKAGNETTTEIPKLTPKVFHLQLRDNQIADMEEVKEKVTQNEAVLIDSRARERYLGDYEPMYAQAGHIPGAKNYFWKEVLDENGSWKKKEALEKQFSLLRKDEEIIVSCGSGISACPNILALKSLDYENVKLYPGSFSDWISYDENEVTIGENA